MQAMLDELAQAVRPGARAVVLMDRTGWHVARDLTIPPNLTPLFLPLDLGEGTKGLAHALSNDTNISVQIPNPPYTSPIKK